MSGDNILQFSPFISAVDPSFWHKITQLKLDVDKLNENTRQIWGYYDNKAPQGLKGTLTVDCSSFNVEPDGGQIISIGKIINKNTIESFKDEDKGVLIANEGKALLEIIKHEAVERPSLLSRFLILSFADLKKYHYYYWFAFPTPNFISYELQKTCKVTEVLSQEQIGKICDGFMKTKNVFDRNYFILKTSGGGLEYYLVKDGLGRMDSSGDWMIGFVDSCEDPEHPGWPLRNFLTLVTYHCRDLTKSPLTVLSLRLHLTEGRWSASQSLVSSVLVRLDEGGWGKAGEGEGWVGWERNERGKMGPRFANLSATMDPVKLAETSVDLNLKLMKWRLLPDLNLDVIKATRCLLLGAGTLGSTVARCLMAWGVQHITLLDNGRVSYSNPVRQSLYGFQDCQGGGKEKAIAASEALSSVYPGVNSKGVVLSIPMPGHTVGGAMLEETRSNVAQLELLIEEHDVTFLLMDSRESRWLPSLITASKRKLCINAALGFDSYLVMRHGVKPTSDSQAAGQSTTPPSSKLGCYFCNDVTAPGNTGKLRTLDQQCTVTRPGVSNIAGALAVELMVSILQHPLQGLAPAESNKDSTDTDSCLGLVPHSIRGFLSHFETLLPATEAFTSCVACSDKVIAEYESRGFEFVLQALESKDYLEELTGLSQLHADSLMSQLIEYSGSECEDTE